MVIGLIFRWLRKYLNLLIISYFYKGGLPIDNKNLDQMLHKLYDKGVRAGSFFMAIYTISCSFYSFYLQSLINKFSKLSLFYMTFENYLQFI